MSLLNEPTLPERQRPQEANHIRTIEVQVLDALLRIEELLSNLNECLTAPRGPTIDMSEAPPSMSQFVSKEDLEDAKEQAKKPDGVTKKKNPRSL